MGRKKVNVTKEEAVKVLSDIINQDTAYIILSEKTKDKEGYPFIGHTHFISGIYIYESYEKALSFIKKNNKDGSLPIGELKKGTKTSVVSVISAALTNMIDIVNINLFSDGEFAGCSPTWIFETMRFVNEYPSEISENFSLIPVFKTRDNIAEEPAIKDENVENSELENNEEPEIIFQDDNEEKLLDVPEAKEIKEKKNIIKKPSKTEENREIEEKEETNAVPVASDDKKNFVGTVSPSQKKQILDIINDIKSDAVDKMKEMSIEELCYMQSISTGKALITSIERKDFDFINNLAIIKDTTETMLMQKFNDIENVYIICNDKTNQPDITASCMTITTQAEVNLPKGRHVEKTTLKDMTEMYLSAPEAAMAIQSIRIKLNDIDDAFITPGIVTHESLCEIIESSLIPDDLKKQKKISHTKPIPLLTNKPDDKLHVGAFLTFLNMESFDGKHIGRPTVWGTYNIVSGTTENIYKCSDTDFTSAEYQTYSIAASKTFSDEEKMKIREEERQLFDRIRRIYSVSGLIDKTAYKEYLDSVKKSAPESYSFIYDDMGIIG